MSATSKPVLGSVDGKLHFPVPSINRLNQTEPPHFQYCRVNKTESAILMLFCLIVASLGSLCFKNFVLHNSRCQVPCCSRKKLPRTSLQCCCIFWSFGIIDGNTIQCWELSTAQAGARGREGCCTYSLSLMYRLNKTESAILMLFCCD
jgi:hypothetical protein